MNPYISQLQPYPFDKLSRLKEGITASTAHGKALSLAVGEPQHPVPDFVGEILAAGISLLSKYPATAGSAELRQAISAWLSRRFGIASQLVDPERHVLPVNGTREALFSFAHCLVDPGRDALVLMPNPFYQIYEGAALLSGARPYYVNATAKTGWIPDYDGVPEEIWQRCQLLYVCSPGNPTGSVLDRNTYVKLIKLAERYDFVIAADECYSEIYFDELAPPPGLLEVAAQEGIDDFARCMVFHSLSKRSSLPGMRSGFVAGDASVIEKYRLYRTYHGCAMPPPFQEVSRAAWSDERHVVANRELYRRKIEAVLAILQPVIDVERPGGGFYLWPNTAGDDQAFARSLFHKFNLTVLPGSYLSRQSNGVNPGSGRVRIALTPSLDETIDAAGRLRQFVNEIAVGSR